MRRGESKKSPRRLAAFERLVLALQLRTQGRTFQEFALMAKFNSRQAAHQSANQALARILKATTTQQVEAALDALRLDEQQVPIMRAALTGAPPGYHPRPHPDAPARAPSGQPALTVPCVQQGTANGRPPFSDRPSGGTIQHGLVFGPPLRSGLLATASYFTFLITLPSFWSKPKYCLCSK